MDTSSEFSDVDDDTFPLAQTGNADASSSCRGFRSEEFDWLRRECETVDPAMIERRAEYRMEHPLGRRFAK